jgi:hypothetical protein
MFSDSDVEALTTSAVGNFVVSNVQRDISARNYTGLMDKSLCEVTNMRCEPFEETFSNYEHGSVNLVRKHFRITNMKCGPFEETFSNYEHEV